MPLMISFPRGRLRSASTGVDPPLELVGYMHVQYPLERLGKSYH